MDPKTALALAHASPRRVAEQDKDGWLALFARGAVVEDPVGAAPNHRGAPRFAISRFYDTFIQGNEIRFEVHDEVACAGEVVRDVTIHTRLSSGVAVVTPVFLIYEVIQEDGEARLRRLAAHWDFRRMSWSIVSGSWRGPWATSVQTARMLRHMGIGGMLRYSRAATRGVFDRGHRVAEALAADPDAAVARSFAADATVSWSAEEPVGAEALAERWSAAERVELSKLLSSGWVTAFRYTVHGGGQGGGQGAEAKPARGVAFLEFDPREGTVARARLFPFTR